MNQKTCQICGDTYIVSKFNKEDPKLYVCQYCDDKYRITDGGNKRGRKNRKKNNNNRA
jgi:ribosome-binding protein aMBF1 (putative translation factor)